MRAYSRRSRFGLALIGLGFLLQFVALWIDAGGSRPLAFGFAIQPVVLQILIGLLVTLLLGFAVGPLVRHISGKIPIPPPVGADTALVTEWQRLATQHTGGVWIGAVERPIFFAACWLQAWLLLSAWLVFKLALYWQGANFTAFPRSMPDAQQLAWIAAKRQLGTHHVATALVGTGANLGAAFIGVAIGKWFAL